MAMTTRPIRVGIPFTGEQVGGSHVSTLLLARALDPARVLPVFLVHSDGAVADWLRRHKVPFAIKDLPYRELWGRGPAQRFTAVAGAAASVRRLIRRQKIDLVHVQDHKAFQLWAIGCRLASCPMVLHWRKDYRKSYITHTLFTIPEQIICVSEFSKKYLPDVAQRKARVVLNPFDTTIAIKRRSSAQGALRDRLSVSAGARILAFVGTLHSRKRPGVFVETVARIRRKREDVFGVVCGAGDANAVGALREAIANTGVGNGVWYLGFVDRITDVLAGADMLVAPSVREPYGRALVEAMLLGMPVVAAASGGNSEILEDGRTGRLVPDDDIQAFIAACTDLLDNPDRARRLGAAARTEAERRFSVQVHAEEMMAVYDHVLRR